MAEDADAESFENESYWGSEVSGDAEEAEESAVEAEPEADTYVYGEDESQADDASVESEPAEDSDEAAHEVVADGSTDDAVDDSSATSEPESEPAASEAAEPAETEVYASEDVEVHASEGDVELDDADAPEDSASEVEVEDEPQAESTVDEWRGVDDSHEDYEIDSAGDDVVADPVPQKKRNGGGSRGKKVVGLKVGASQIAAAVVSGNGENPARSTSRAARSRKASSSGASSATTKLSSVRSRRSSRRAAAHEERPSRTVFQPRRCQDVRHRRRRGRGAIRQRCPLQGARGAPGRRERVRSRLSRRRGAVHRDRRGLAQVLLVVAPRDQVEPYIEACREAGIRLAGIDLESFGLLRAFVPPFGTRSRTEDSATVVVSIGHESSTLLVAGGGICEFTRVFDWGGGQLQNAIADELEVPHMEAATILTHLSLSGPGRHLDSLDADTRSRALDAVRTRLTPFARELVSSLQFYQTQPESLGIREIVITGGTAHLEGLADALNQMIGVSVSVGDPLARVDVQVDIRPALDATIGSLAVPIGLAIEDEPGRSVNLLPKEARQTTKPPRLLAVAAPLAAAVPLAALAFLFMQASGTAGDRQSELEVVRAQIDALPEPTKPTLDPTLAADQASRATAVAQILGTRLTWERVLGDVSRVLPSGVSLTELTATAPQPTTPEVVPTTTDASSTTTSSTPAPAPPPPTAITTPTGVTVAGYALNYADIARTLARLQAVPSLTSAELESATPTKLGKKRVIQFTIVAALATPGGVQ